MEKRTVVESTKERKNQTRVADDEGSQNKTGEDKENKEKKI
jgi:hypothetical protein